MHKYYHDQDGASRYMIGLMRMQEAAGHTVAPFAMHEDRNLPTPWSEFFVPEMKTSGIARGLGALRQMQRALWSFESARYMRRILEAFSPDVVHVHNIYTHLSPSVLWECKRRGIPVVMTAHDYALVSANYSLWGGDHPLRDDERGFFSIVGTRFIKGSRLATFALEGIVRFQRARRYFDSAISYYITLSTFVRGELITSGIAKEKCVVIPPFSEPLVRNMPLETGERSGVLFAGRLEDYKGVQLALRLAEVLPGIQFYFAGTGPLALEVQRIAALRKNVTYVGFLRSEALWAMMAQVRVVLVPSQWYEPFGLVALEGLTTGAAVVVSDRGGLPEVLGLTDKPEVVAHGAVVRAQDIEGYKKAVRHFALNNDVEAARLTAQAARSRAEEVGDPQVHNEAVMAIYQQVVQK